MTGSDRRIPLGANHRRALASSLSLLDETLCRFEEWARGREVKSVLYEERNDLDEEQRAALRAEVEAMHEHLERLRAALKLPRRRQSAANDIWSWCSVLWKDVEELESRHLRRYGALEKRAADFIDPEIRALSAGLERLSALVSRSRPAE